MESLRGLGYETYSAVDNVSKVNTFVDDIINFGRADPPIETKGLGIKQYDYDDNPLYDYLALLRRWLGIRQKSGAQKAALYCDIMTLHGGVHAADEKEWWKRDEVAHYKKQVLSLFGDMEKFFDDLAATGRNYVVVFIPEHGAALRGSSIQPKGLRDIPLPQITNIPVGIKLIGAGHPRLPARQELVTRPASYLAISYLLSSFAKEPPFGVGGQASLDKILAGVPETNFVSENEIVKVVKRGKDYFLFDKDRKWLDLPPSALQ